MDFFTSNTSYSIVIGLSLILILSFVFNLISRRSGVPSVLMLIVLGMGINFGIKALVPGGEELSEQFFSALEILGILGLIMIVLEAALDLKLTKDKTGLILKSFSIALLCLVGTTFAIALLLELFMVDNFFSAVVYALPLSVLSSAIVIPSVKNLETKTREFLVYDSTFSDILGIMIFYLMVENAHESQAQIVVMDVVTNIGLTLALAFLVSYGLVLIFQKITSEVKLFLLIAVLMLLYSVGKLFHLSSLVVILIFGLLLNNHDIFFRGVLKRWIDEKATNTILKDFHLVTAETAFVVRTFFFVLFGMTITLASLFNLQVAILSAAMIISMYAVRFICLYFISRENLFPGLLIAPRGLITVLLFFSIPEEFQSDNFDSGILFFCIIATSVVMSFGLISAKKAPAEKKTGSSKPEEKPQQPEATTSEDKTQDKNQPDNQQ